MADSLRIAVIDDHPMFREGVVRTLEREGNIEVVAQGSSAAEALQIAQDALPDIVLLDISMPGGGIAAATAITAACPIVKIVMLTVSEDEKTVMAALSAGARGYLLKGVSGSELVQTLWSIQQGMSYVSPSLAARLLVETQSKKGNGRASDSNPLELLTLREEQILSGVAEGLSNREIGNRLGLTEKTVKHYMTNILQKLQVTNRVTAALLAQRNQPKKP